MHSCITAYLDIFVIHGSTVKKSAETFQTQTFSLKKGVEIWRFSIQKVSLFIEKKLKILNLIFFGYKVELFFLFFFNGSQSNQQ